jgi:hypothetical protein
VLPTKGLNAEAVGDSLVPTPWMELMKGSLSRCDTALRKLPAGSLAGDVVATAERAKLLSRLDCEPSSGVREVSRVSGVPLKDSAPPLDDRGDDGLSAWCAIAEDTEPVRDDGECDEDELVLPGSEVSLCVRSQREGNPE